ncbi:MAG: hydantoinase/oxoprolinase family protein [Deltaproteobacteria bacterium]|nr:hydantoinase/oxoprolinase family protein [Deltaproteobacteria bacterium]
MSGPYRIGIDVGGTFTDFLLLDGQGHHTLSKVPTTTGELSEGVLSGLRELARREGLALEAFLREVALVVHGTTVTTNAVLTGSGARVGLLTTKGFRDILQMRRGTREEQYNNKALPPPPLVPAHLRHPVEERIDWKGEVLTPLCEPDVAAGLERFGQHQVQAVTVCFMHAYANGAHESQAREVVRRLCPDLYLTVSHELLSQVRLYDRVSTAVLNSYVGPILSAYLRQLAERLRGAGFRGVLLIMQSNGGVTSPEDAMARAASTLLSGPAAGPVAGLTYARLAGFSDCITVDMGGTSFDASLVKDGVPLLVTDGRIAGYLIALPMLAIHTIGAGGGSTAWLDEGGLLRVGPQSAGAMPGPACYGQGGTRPTCTDADLLLGYLDPNAFFGGRMRLHRGRAEQAIQAHIASPLGLDVVEAAAGMYRVINVNMATGIEEVSVKRGLDPRQFPLVVGGGAGPVHAGMLALELGMPLILIPRQSSILCAVGMLLTDLKHDYVTTCYVPVAQADPGRLLKPYQEMEAAGRRLLLAEGVTGDKVMVRYACDMRYIGQFHEVLVPVEQAEVEESRLPAVVARFHQEHDRLYGYAVPDADARPPAPLESTQKGRRPAYLPAGRRFAEVPVYDGERLGSGHRVPGPALVEQPTTTVFIPPEFTLACDRYGNYALYLTARAAEFEERLAYGRD